MRFEVPQFIEIEDKIFGPFTWRQFIYLVGGVGFAVVLFFVFNIFIFILIGVPIGGLGILLAFYQVNNRPFVNYLAAIVGYASKSKRYLWRKTGTGIYGNQPSQDDPDTNLSIKTPRSGKNSLSSLSKQLELKAIQREDS